MTSPTYIIVRVDYGVIPASVDYLSHCDTPYGQEPRYTNFRESATIYDDRREAIAQANLSHRAFCGRRYIVRHSTNCTAYWDSSEA